MKCFDQPDADGVAICTACAKGICSACAVDLGRATVCRGRCEQEGRRIVDLRDFSFAQPSIQEAALRRADRTYVRSGMFYLAFGAVMTTTGIIWGRRLMFVTVMGALIAAFGAVNLLMARRKLQQQQFRLCAKCGYNVTGNTSGRCPECGFQV